MSESGDDCALRHVSWNTQGSEPRHQFDFYRDGLCHAFAHLSPTNPSPKPEFLALIDTWASPRHAYTVMSAPSHLVSRTRADLAAVADNDYYLNFMLRGEMALAQHFGDTHLQAGEMMVVDNGHLYGARISAGNGHKHLAFRLVRSDYPARAMQDSSRFTWHPLAPLLKQHLTYLATPVCAGDPNSQILICEMIESLVAAIATADGPDTNAASRKIRDQLLFEINRNIGSSQYALGDAARTLGLAPRTIQIHLAALGTRFSVILRDRRLETAFAALNTKDRRQSIDTVAFETGFESTAAFYRAFKKKYHCTPAETHRHAKLSS